MSMTVISASSKNCYGLLHSLVKFVCSKLPSNFRYSVRYN